MPISPQGRFRILGGFEPIGVPVIGFDNATSMRLIFAGLIFSLSSLAQQTGDFSITGVVVNAQTGEPVKYALVTLVGFHEFDASQPRDLLKAQRPVQKTAQAGPAGEFQFNGLAKAHYTLTARKPGFGAESTAKEIRLSQIDPTDSVAGVQLRLAPLGIIEGKVLDQNDEPLRGVNIIALQVQIVDGLRDSNSTRSVATDDRGLYRLWNLTPGQYYIKAAGKSGGTYRYVGDGAPYYSSWQSFTPVYFGGARTLDSATPVQIESGSKMSADFRLNVEPAFKIRGMLANAPAGPITFELLQGPEDVSASRTSLNTSTGKFEVQDVTPGAYILRATQEGKMRGESPVTVNEGDVNGVSISLAPAVTVQGVTRVVGAPLKVKQIPGFERLLDAMGAGSDEKNAAYEQDVETTCNVFLHERGGGARAQSGSRRRPPRHAERDDESGAFTIGDVLPGIYSIRVQCYNGYPTSVLSGGVDLLANPNLVIQPGASPAPIEVQVKPGGGTLQGEFAVRPLPKNPGVLLLPSFSNSSGPVMIPIGIAAESQQKVEFGMPFLAPGDYAVYAFSNWQKVEFRNPAFLQTLSGGASVRIEDGKEQQVVINSIVK